MKPFERKRITGIVLAATLIALPLPASPNSQDEALDEALLELQDEEVITLPDGGLEKAVSCSGRTCSGKVNELISKVLIQQGHVRLLARQGLGNAMGTYGCVETWSVWMHNDMANRDLMVNQITVAEALGETLSIIFKKDPAADHCDIDWIYRAVGF